MSITFAASHFLLGHVLVPVYATMRNLSKGEALVQAAGRTLGRTLEIKQLDVCDENSIRACVDSLPDRRVDVLSQFMSFPSPKVFCCGVLTVSLLDVLW